MTLFKPDTSQNTLRKRAGEGGDGKPGYRVPAGQTVTPEVRQEAPDKKVCTRLAREEETTSM